MEYKIRSYDDSDFEECLKLVDSIWGFTRIINNWSIGMLFLTMYFLFNLKESTYAIVIEEKGKVIGFLFARITSEQKLCTKHTTFLAMLKLLARFFMSEISFSEKCRYMKMFRDEDKFSKKYIKINDNEILLFAISPAMQGKGFGKTLIGQFINECEKRKKDSIKLITDIKCNYGFYEHLEFVKIGEYASPVLKEFTGENELSFVYRKKITDFV
jgi:GNAT superfamily N-acetyltransferase